MKLIVISDGFADIADGQMGQLQKLRGLCHAVIQQKILWSPSHHILKDLPEIAPIQTAIICNVLHGDIILEILFHISQCFFNIEVTDPPAFLCCHIGG